MHNLKLGCISVASHINVDPYVVHNQMRPTCGTRFRAITTRAVLVASFLRVATTMTFSHKEEGFGFTNMKSVNKANGNTNPIAHHGMNEEESTLKESVEAGRKTEKLSKMSKDIDITMEL
ncbi:hypothetical protein G5I_13295 [Acromyrmex echinatior]|uniref:Uncharacterized protein n=1 Tax=Acromyrmex echinatior TaxID=103372 RepID=F4X4M7_ACREC|nr:hypothetical protein G5I_13295 [Acromyrmex echinatior]